MSDMLTTAEVAKLAGITPASLRRYLVRGTAPAPDGHLGRTPWWHQASVDAWLASRTAPGRPSGEKRTRLTVNELMVLGQLSGYSKREAAKKIWPMNKQPIQHSVPLGQRCLRCSQMGMRWRQATQKGEFWEFVCDECAAVETAADFEDEDEYVRFHGTIRISGPFDKTGKPVPGHPVVDVSVPINENGEAHFEVSKMAYTTGDLHV